MEHFFYNAQNLQSTLTTSYHAGLVVMSLLVAFLASFAGFSIIGRIKAADQIKTSARWFWLLAGALTTGGGGWAMHFVGLLALKLPLAVSYDISHTAWSIMPTVFCNAVVLHSLSRSRNSKTALLLGGLVLGCGFGGTHTMGMAAMHGVDHQLIMLLEPMRFVATTILATVLPVIAVFVSYSLVSGKQTAPSLSAKLNYSLINTTAIVGMHYAAMAATLFMMGEPISDLVGKHVLNSEALAVWVSLSALFVASFAILMSIVDSRLQQAAHEEALSRSRMREAIESIVDGFSLYDTNDCLVECNQQYRELMDAGQGILPGMSFESVIRAAAEAGLILDAIGQVDVWVEKRLAHHRAPRGQFIESHRDKHWINIRERRIWEIGTMAIYTDISELKQEQAYREQILHTEAALERHRSLAQMVAGVAHEINTPLGIASTAVSIIENRLNAPKIQTLFSYSEENMEMRDDLLESAMLLKNNVIRAHKLVESFKKVSVGQASDQLEKVKLLLLLQDCVDLFKINARKAKLVINVDISRLQGSSEWLGYAGQMTQVMMNLLENIERYAYPEGQGGVVDISIFDDGDAHFHISVRDYGQGIAAKNLDQVFEPFFTTGRSKGGTGLGLAIVSNIVTSLFKGTITVNSKPGQGCCFTLSFPKNSDDSIMVEAGGHESARSCEAE